MTVYYSSFTPATPTSGVAGTSLVDSNSNITIDGSGIISGIGTGNGTAIDNTNITIASNGTLSGGGGGSVTIGGLGYIGDLNATFGARSGVNLRNFADTVYLGDSDIITSVGTAAAITGQAATATSSDFSVITGTTKPDSNATNDRYFDRRTTNDTPAWYLANYNLRTAYEFKDASVLGVPGGSSGFWGALVTTNDYVDFSGGAIKQRFTYGSGVTPGTSYVRYGSGTTWTDWLKDFNGYLRPTFDSSDLLETGSTVATVANFKTSVGTAASIASQGALATLNSVGSSQLSNGAILSNHMAYLDSLNLIADPDFRSTQWFFAGTLNTTDSIVTGTGAAQMGVRAAYKLSASGAVGQSPSWLYLQESSPPQAMPAIEAPATYLGSTKIAVTAGYNGFLMLYWYWFNEAGDVLLGSNSTTIANFSPPNGGTVATVNQVIDISNVKMAIPAGGRRLRYGVYAVWPSGIASAGTAYGAKPRVTREVGQTFLSTNAVRLGTNIVRADGSTSLTDALAVTSLGTAAGITGQGPGATAPGSDVLNYTEASSTTFVARPSNGAFSSGSATVTGAIKIALPVLWTNVMMRFRVEVFDYASGRSCTYLISGYNYTGTGAGGYWVNCSAQFIGREQDSKQVVFGSDATNAVVWIGTPSSTWSYVSVTVLDFFGRIGSASSTYKTGWVVSLDTSTQGNIGGWTSGVITVAKPRAADAVFGENVFEATSGTTATLANFKTSVGTAASIASQGALATKSAVNLASTEVTNKSLANLDSTASTKLTGIEANADVTINAQVVVTPPDNVIINADYLGAIISGQFNKVLTPTVLRGGTSVRTDNRATYSVTNITGGLTGFVSVNNTTASADKGRVTVTNCTSNGTFQLNILWDAVTISSFVIHFTVVPANPPLGGGGSGGTKSGSVDLTGFSYTGTTFVQAGRINGLVKGSGETIRCSLAAATYQYVHTSSGDRTTTGKFQYSVSGANSWTDVGTAVNGTASFWYAGDFSGDEGSITVTQNVAPSDATYDVRFVVAHTDTSGGNSTFTFGTMSVIIGV